MTARDMADSRNRPRTQCVVPGSSRTSAHMWQPEVRTGGFSFRSLARAAGVVPDRLARRAASLSSQKRGVLRVAVVVCIVALTAAYGCSSPFGVLPSSGEALVIGSRYHAGYGYGNSGYYDSGSSGGSEMLMPPVAWLFQDWERTKSSCPVLVGLCAAAAVGYVLQHWLGRCVPFQRITVFYPPTLKAGEVWRLFTHVFLHGDLGHLLVNMLHVFNTLDLESVPFGMGYPDRYALGSKHVAGVAATAAAYGALVGSVPYWGAMFEGLSAVCFGLDGALLASCGLLLGSGAAQTSLQSFLQVRGFYAAAHMGFDVLRGCSSPGGTVGNLSHFAGFVAGFCYILAVLPNIGGRSVPTIPCLISSSGRWREEECVAIFSAQYSLPVGQAQNIATALLVLGPAFALLNAFFGRGKNSDASADGYSLCCSRKAPGSASRQLGGAGGRVGHDPELQQALSRSMQTYADERRGR